MSEEYEISFYGTDIKNCRYKLSVGKLSNFDLSREGVIKMVLDCAEIIELMESEIAYAEEMLSEQHIVEQDLRELLKDYEAQNQDRINGIIPDDYTAKSYKKKLEEELMVLIEKSKLNTDKKIKLESMIGAYETRLNNIKNSNLDDYLIGINHKENEIVVVYSGHRKPDEDYDEDYDEYL